MVLVVERIMGRTVVGRALRRSDDCSNHSVLVVKYGIVNCQAESIGVSRSRDVTHVGWTCEVTFRGVLGK